MIFRKLTDIAIPEFPFFFPVCSAPGQSKFPTGLYPGWRDQQAEANWTPDCPFPSDLTSDLSVSH